MSPPTHRFTKGSLCWLMVLFLLFSAHSAFCGTAPQGTAGSDQKTHYDEMVVTGTRSMQPLADVPVDTVLISREEIERSSAGNLPQLLRGVPGLSATNLDDTMAADNLRLTMRGLQLNEGYGLLLVNGQRVHGGLGAHGDYGVSLNQVPLSMIERVEIVKGASSALYGADAMAGVINIITRRVPDIAEGAIGADFGIYDVMPRKGRPVEDSTRRRHREYASFGAPLLQSSGLLVHLSRETDEGAGQSPQNTTRESAMTRWNTEFNHNLSVELGGDFSRSRRETTRDVTTERYDREIDESRIHSAMRYEDLSQTWTISGYVVNQEFVQGYPGFAHGYRFGDIGYNQVESVYTWHGHYRNFTIGAEAQRQSMDYMVHNFDDDGALDSEISVDRDIDTYAVFLQDEMFLRDGLVTLVPGIRYEDHDTFGDEFNPKLSAAIHPNDETTWRMSVGRAFKSPTIRQLYYDDMYRHGDFFFRSNPDLSPEKAVNYNLSVEREFPDGNFRARLGGFRTDLKDKVVRFDTGDEALIGGEEIPIISYRNVDKARIEGLELSFRSGSRTGFTLRGSGAWTRAKDRDSGHDLPYVPEFTASMVPGYITQTGITGIEIDFTAIGSQYRDVDNENKMDAHQVVDLRLWRALTARMTASIHVGNIFESHKGEADYASRTGRSIGLSIKGKL